MIKLENYSKIIKKRMILDSVNLNVSRGECLGILGRNASGKTMILRAMAGLILPTTGSAVVAGESLKAGRRFPESMGLIIETTDFWPLMTGRQTLEYLNTFRKTASSADIEDAMERVGLDPFDNRRVLKFSLGMKQKLAIAQAIFEKPDLLLFDEPTNSLDRESREDFYQIIREEKERGCTIVIASHIQEDLDFCDRLVEIENGKLIQALGQN